MALTENATITDIAPNLSQSKEYVRRVLENMHNFAKEHGTAIVRIGTTGIGVAPHYRIQTSIIGQAGELMATFGPEKEEDEYFQAFHGRSHERTEWGSAELRHEHWSSRGMTVEQVQNLLGELRGFRRPSTLKQRPAP